MYVVNSFLGMLMGFWWYMWSLGKIGGLIYFDLFLIILLVIFVIFFRLFLWFYVCWISWNILDEILIWIKFLFNILFNVVVLWFKYFDLFILIGMGIFVWNG